MTTHDVHRLEENMFGSFAKSPTTASIASFRSMTTDLMGLLPGGSSFSRIARDRPTSDILQHQLLNMNQPPPLTEAEVIDQWFENIQRYEQMLEDVAAASLDQTFKDELQHVNQWFHGRSDAERTAALYSVVQCASPIQVRFLIMVLQQLANQELEAYANQDKDSMAGGPVPGSVVDTESEYERRKRQFYRHRYDHLHGKPTTQHHHQQHQQQQHAHAMHQPIQPPSKNKPPVRITSASSEPDDHLRRNRSLFGRSSSSITTPSTSMLGNSVLTQQGLLYEKALAARAQIQAAQQQQQQQQQQDASNAARLSSRLSSASSIASSLASSAAAAAHPTLFGTDWPFPLVRNTTNAPTNANSARPALGRVNHAAAPPPPPPASNSMMETASFASSSSWSPSKKNVTWSSAGSTSGKSANKGLAPAPSSSSSRHLHLHASNQQPMASLSSNATSSLYSSINALEKAQARLRAADQQRQQQQRQRQQQAASPSSMANRAQNQSHQSLQNHQNQPPSPPHSQASDVPPSVATSVTMDRPLATKARGNTPEETRAKDHKEQEITKLALPAIITPSTSSTPLEKASPRPSPRPSPSNSTTVSLSSASSQADNDAPQQWLETPTTTSSSPLQKSPAFLTPPIFENEVLDTSLMPDSSQEEAQLTGVARRRKRSSAARALKDKIAAETVDLELMKDVQNWMRSLRLHKYGHAFEGMQWQQVIRMDDDDMERAGVNTLGARRKLLKVFENVQRHCQEHEIDF